MSNTNINRNGATEAQSGANGAGSDNMNRNGAANRGNAMGSNGTDSRAGMARSDDARMSNRSRSARSSGAASARDNMADQLNGQSLQAATQGRPYSAGSSDMGGSTGGRMSAPNAAAGASSPQGGSK